MPLAFAALLGFQLMGEITVRLLALPVPGPVVGLILLYGALVARRGVPESLRHTSTVLLQQLMLFLVPATTGLMLHFRRLEDEWVPIVMAGVGGTALTMVVTAVVLRVLVHVRRMP